MHCVQTLSCWKICCVQGRPGPCLPLRKLLDWAALEDEDYSRDLRALVLVRRPRLRQALMALGLYVVPGQANYLLFFCSDTTLDLKLRDRGILIRNCTDFHGLGSGWYRIAVRGEADNNRLIEEMGKVIADG